MDPFTALGVATGVIGLLPLCASGFTVIKDVIKADSALRDIAAAFGVEETRYLTFEKQLELKGVPEADILEALRKKAPEIQHAMILRCLAAISNTFADSKVLDTYGLRLNVNGLDASKDQAPASLPLDAASWKGKAKQLIQGRKTRMDFFRRSKFVLYDSNQVKELILKLKTYLDSLFSTCTYLQMQTFTNILIPDILSMRNVMELLDKLLASQENNPDPQQQAAHDLLRRTVKFAARVKATQSQSFVAMDNKFQFSDNWSVPSKADEIGTMALWDDPVTKDETRLYYIEWKSVESHTGGTEAQLEANVKSLAKIASLKEVPAELRVLPCLGAFKTSGLRYGLVYQLPSHLRYFRRSTATAGEISRRRKPSSLLLLLQSPESRIPEALDLGSRIKLAQRIAQSLLLLQSVGWVHKNVCSQSIIFFRDRSQTGNLPSTTGRLDFDHPYICGFGQSGPDDPTTLVATGAAAIPKIHSTCPYTQDQVKQTRKNLYQHPHKRESPRSSYQPSYDVYSLGCVMLEIGLWQSISSLATENTDESAHVFRDRLVATAESELPGQAGMLYADATTRCLQIRQTGNMEDYGKKLLQQIIEELGSCVI